MFKTYTPFMKKIEKIKIMLGIYENMVQILTIQK
jgi:hypothetical protein